jgi:hypothetical protein
MDLGFARRHTVKNRQTQDALNLATLLADIAARQAMSPTALATAQLGAPSLPVDAAHPESERFAPRSDRKATATTTSSFSPEVASVMHTSRKPF